MQLHSLPCSYTDFHATTPESAWMERQGKIRFPRNYTGKSNGAQGVQEGGGVRWGCRRKHFRKAIGAACRKAG